MNRTFTHLLPAIALAALLTACSTPATRIQDHPALFQRLSPADQALVQRRAVREGMTKDAVFLAWGKPDAVAEGRGEGHTRERWTWFAFRSEFANDTFYDSPFLYRRGRAVYRRIPEPYPISVRYPYRHATFENDHLVEWETIRGL